MSLAAPPGARRLIVPANGLDFEVFEAGAGERVALLLHGFPQHAFMWRHLMAPLAAAGYRVWAVNQRGYGETTRPRSVAAYGLDVLVNDLVALIDAAAGKSVTLIGHDWGGFIAWVVAARRMRPLERLVFINIPHPLCFQRALRSRSQQKKSSYVYFFRIPWLPDRLLAMNGGALTRRLLRRSFLGRDAIPEEALDFYCAEIARPGAATAMLNWYRAAGRDIVTVGGLDAPIDVPTLIVWGLADVALGRRCLEGTERYVPNLRLELLPGVTHWAPEDAPAEVNAHILDFLAQGGETNWVNNPPANDKSS